MLNQYCAANIKQAFVLIFKTTSYVTLLICAACDTNVPLLLSSEPSTVPMAIRAVKVTESLEADAPNASAIQHRRLPEELTAESPSTRTRSPEAELLAEALPTILNEIDFSPDEWALLEAKGGESYAAEIIAGFCERIETGEEVQTVLEDIAGAGDIEASLNAKIAGLGSALACPNTIAPNSF